MEGAEDLEAPEKRVERRAGGVGVEAPPFGRQGWGTLKFG
jgi:hypothetical protein